MKGFTYKESIDRLEKEIKNASGGGGGGGTAADVSYNNTSSGLEASNVQSAIDEVSGAVDEMETSLETISGRFDISTDEIAIGKVGDDILYRKMVDTGALPNATTKAVAHDITGLKNLYRADLIAYGTSDDTYYLVLPANTSSQNISGNVSLSINSTNISIATGANLSTYDHSHIILEYTKTAPVTNTRTRKNK